ncbi:leucyl/phenylalanyl-tRNA--protein transferase [Brevundimonas sp.]|uniref:leucyl/phenylalanyl-tRNA--protein transferase n=1 Tax=Brevundimonas sp. TaxID=1871086 RepID=UPI0025CDDBCD|nr:leucyl/phenylalanyl-tRNA--protein transferase [Brevundimonas sp.]
MTSLSLQEVLGAYAVGVFPMAESRDDPTIYLVDPPERGVIPLEAPILPRRLGRTVRADPFEVRIDSDFERTLDACAAPGPGREDSWINPAIRELYLALHEAGFAHSVECWRGRDFCGGLYGIALGGAFFGESMVSLARDASKVALVHLIARLKAGGFGLLDVQFQTPHLEGLGAVEIERADYRGRLARAVTLDADFYRLEVGASGSRVWQEITQTS